MKSLIGKTIIRVLRSEVPQILVFIVADGPPLAFVAVGDCCSAAFFFQLSGFEDLIGEVVTEVDESETTDKEAAAHDVVSTTFYTIKSRKGRASIEFRLEHNGFYAGSAEPCDAKMLGDDHVVVAGPP